LRQHVGNWPGKTVEKKQGKCVYDGVEIDIIDLPGIYSLTARSVEELIARDYILEQEPDVLVDIVDACNIERNLYLTTLLLELQSPLVLVLNMWDEAQKEGFKTDTERLSQLLGVPVVPTIATRRLGMEELKRTIVETARDGHRRRVVVSYGDEIEERIAEISSLVEKDEQLSTRYPVRWLSIKLLEQDEDALRKISGCRHESEILELVT
jgi:ferrous iron transport protein B